MLRPVVVLASTAIIFAAGWSQTADARDWRLRSLYENYVLEEPPAYYFDDDFEGEDVIIVPPRRMSIYQFEDDYYDPRYEPKKAPARRLSVQKTPVVLNAPKAAALAPAKPGLKPVAAKPAPAPAAAGVTCAKATSVVGTYGFTDVKPVTCTGKVYAFSALRGAKKYEVRISAATGSLTEVKKLQ